MTPPADSETVPLTTRLPRNLRDALRDAAEEDGISTNTLLVQAAEEWLIRRGAGERVDRPDGPNVVDLQPSSGSAFRLIVDGFPVPYVKVHKIPVTNTAVDGFGKATITVGDRFQTTEMLWGEFWKFAWFLANAMAVAAGYTNHGPDAQRVNRHGPAEAVDVAALAAWAERGWTAHTEGTGGSGKLYELALTFLLPHMDDGDLQCYRLRESVVNLLDMAGAREIVTRLIAIGPMQAESPGEPIVVHAPAEEIRRITVGRPGAELTLEGNRFGVGQRTVDLGE